MDFLQELFRGQTQKDNFFLLAGPCVVENQDVLFETAETLKQICSELEIPLVFKSSYTKANRSSVNSFTGIGTEDALNLLSAVRRTYELPIVTDIHTEDEAEMAAAVADVLQIPAFLCRQTSLLVAAARTGKVVNIKKGQFLSPDAMKFAVQKVLSQGNEKVMLTERGTTFGYQDLVVDFRGIPIMQQNHKPVLMDVTHSLQQPNQSTGVTGGQPEMIETIAKCAIAAGADGLFIETHPNPAKALSDGANMLRLSAMRPLLEKLVRVREAIR
jgi:2-dehydro-3-deoxyphosphooctonate aldolase (KDO 8-P synthase)